MGFIICPSSDILNRLDQLATTGRFASCRTELFDTNTNTEQTIEERRETIQKTILPMMDVDYQHFHNRIINQGDLLYKDFHFQDPIPSPRICRLVENKICIARGKTYHYIRDEDVDMSLSHDIAYDPITKSYLTAWGLRDTTDILRNPHSRISTADVHFDTFWDVMKSL